MAAALCVVIETEVRDLQRPAFAKPAYEANANTTEQDSSWSRNSRQLSVEPRREAAGSVALDRQIVGTSPQQDFPSRV